MSLRDVVDVAGYVLGAGLLIVAAVAQWRGWFKPARETVWFCIPAAVMLIYRLCLPGIDNRLLAYVGLLGAWLVGQIAWPKRATKVLSWGVRLCMLFVMADAAWHLGRAGWINPNLSGAILVLGLPFVDDVRWAGLWVIALLCTGSRGAIVSMALPLVWWNRSAIMQRYKRAALALAVVGVLLVVVRPGTILARFDHWQAAARLFMASPLVGWGLGRYIHVSAIAGQNHADNAVLTVLAEQGLVGLLALIPLGIVIARRWRYGSDVTRLVLLACLLHNLVDDTWLQPWPALLLGLNLAMLWRPDEVPETTLANAGDADSGAGAPAPALSAPVE